MQTKRMTIVAALLALYLIWGGSYFVIRVGVSYWPPLLLAGLRFALAGALLLAWARWRGCAWPNWRESRNAALIGLLLVTLGNGCINLAETRVSSGTTALVLATDPLFIALCARLFGVKTDRRQWTAIFLGFTGIIVLNQGSSLSGSPVAASLLILSNVGWALGSVLSQKLLQAKGTMASAMMMLTGGVELFACSAFAGERITRSPPLSGWLALIFLVLFASIVAFSAYMYLLEHVSTTLATSYAYINPIVAEILGVWLLAEHVGRAEWIGMVIILLSVLLIVRHHSGNQAGQTPSLSLKKGILAHLTIGTKKA
jgi:drug/metabolite transporter (DMT)-like permease